MDGCHKPFYHLPSIFKTRFVLWLVFWWMFDVRLLFLCTVLPFSLFIIVLDRSFKPINIYSTVISVIGVKKNKTVASSKLWCIKTRSSTTVHHELPWPSLITPVCNASGTAKLIDKIQIKKIYFTARDSFDIVCDKNGWQIAK